MFGRRFDGWALRSDDTFMKMIPLIMKKRNDAQVSLSIDVDCSYMDNYIKQKRKEGIKISHMAIILAAYVRAISQRPEINRFVIGSTVYVRNQITVSFALVKEISEEGIVETTVKLHFKPTDTIFDVSEKIERIIAKEKKVTSKSPTDKVASLIFKVPFIAPVTVGLIKIMDRLGLLPMFLINASPFHTSLFITNMASIRMPSVYHHIYNFGTTSVFVSMGQKKEQATSNKNGEVKTKWVSPMSFVIDERITNGATYARALHLWEKFIKKPELLEVPPEIVRYDNGRKYKYKIDNLEETEKEVVAL